MVHLKKGGKMRDDTLENQFTERYETRMLEDEIEGEAKFEGESSVLEKKEE
jgi:hypothetical protein